MWGKSAECIRSCSPSTKRLKRIIGRACPPAYLLTCLVYWLEGRQRSGIGPTYFDGFSCFSFFRLIAVIPKTVKNTSSTSTTPATPASKDHSGGDVWKLANIAVRRINVTPQMTASLIHLFGRNTETPATAMQIKATGSNSALTNDPKKTKIQYKISSFNVYHQCRIQPQSIIVFTTMLTV